MNTFGWKIQHDNIDITPVTLIENAISKQKCAEISEQILEYKENHYNEEGFGEDNNPGCWRGFPHLEQDDTKGLSAENKQLIFETIMEAFRVYKQSWQIPQFLRTTAWQKSMFDEEQIDISAWANVNDKGAGNVVHAHAGAVASGCLYFQSSDTGPIEFYNNNYLQGYSHPTWPYNGTMRYYPNEGDILMFPSFLLHAVEANPSEKQRINMAFNYQYMPKQ